MGLLSQSMRSAHEGQHACADFANDDVLAADARARWRDTVLIQLVIGAVAHCQRRAALGDLDHFLNKRALLLLLCLGSSRANFR